MLTQSETCTDVQSMAIIMYNCVKRGQEFSFDMKARLKQEVRNNSIYKPVHKEKKRKNRQNYM